MKEFDKNEFDEIFRAGLTAPDLNEVDEDWELMKARLQSKPNRSKAPYYLLFISSVAALLLLVSSLIFNNEEAVQDQTLVSVPNTSQIESDVKASDIDDKLVANVPDETFSGYTGSIPQVSETIYYNEATFRNDRPVAVTETSASASAGNPIILTADSSLIVAAQAPLILAENVDAESTIITSSLTNDNNSPVTENIAGPEDSAEPEKQSNDLKSRLSLAINFAPDLNAVDQFQSDKLSYTIGAGLIYNVSKKISIEAGAAYGRKSYQTGFSSFRPASYNLFPIKPNQVSSGFDVMDIQLNMAYTLMTKGKSTIGLGAGISSYLMLDEQYSFTYPNINARGLSSFHTGYQNNHFFGIANLNLSYKRHLTNNVQLAFNPYLKLPLTELGYGNIRLRSAGMSVGVITKLNKNKK